MVGRIAVRIGTWNVEYADRSATNRRRGQIMRDHPADIWVLTETHDDLHPGEGFEPVHSAQRPFYGNRVKEGSRWVSIWSRFPILERVIVTGGDRERTVAALIAAPPGPLIVYGTVLPWNGDMGRLGESPGASGWSEFYRVVPQQIEEWKAIRARLPEAALCVAGDFNTDMGTGGYYGTRKGIKMLLEGLAEVSAFCATGPDRQHNTSLEYPPIDHIALPLAWAGATRIAAAWEGRSGSPRLSDHSGMVVETEGVP